MTPRQSAMYKAVLFAAGLIIIAVSFFLLNAGRIITPIDYFTWASILIMYWVVFCPLFFSSYSLRVFNGSIPSIAIIWTSILIYTGASIVVIVLLRTFIISFRLALVIQMILLFFFAILVYYGYFSHSHADYVEAREHNQRHYLREMKEIAVSLEARIPNLPQGTAEVQKLMKRTLEDIRFISPIENDRGTDLEIKIIDTLRTIEQYWDILIEGGNISALDKDIRNLQMLIRERKSLRN